MEHYHAVIMAGGGGTRLWPLSRRFRPKQSLRLVGERTLFQMAVDRVLPIIPAERVWVVTAADQADILRQQTSEIPDDNYLIEPMPKGTAAVVGYAAVALRARDEKAVMACLTADHYIADPAAFRELLIAAHEVAEKGHLVTLGIRPTYPATGYGYIHRRDRMGAAHGHEVFRAASFKEKPDADTARAYIADGGYVWNSGMFIWRVSRILEEFERLMPELHAVLREIAAAWGLPTHQEVLEKGWGRLKPETIDYGIMEKAADVAVVEADALGWTDIGDWNRLFELLPADEDGNRVLAATTLLEDTFGCLILQDSETSGERLIATLGVEDLVVVDAGDVVLVCRRDRADDVRELVRRLSRVYLEKYS